MPAAGSPYPVAPTLAAPSAPPLPPLVGRAIYDLHTGGAGGWPHADGLPVPPVIQPTALVKNQEEVPAPVPEGFVPDEGIVLDFSSCTSCGTCCVPGRERQCCPVCGGRTRVGRFVAGAYNALCCPDPCYEPRWVGLANSAFFVDDARPQTHQRMRWDAGLRMIYPDRAEYFWARADGNGLGPHPIAPAIAASRVDYDELSLYNEVGTSSFAFFINTPYRDVTPVGVPHGSGFTDIDLGTKTVLFDSDLVLLTLQFRTFIPSGATGKGLGTGHASLEPSLLAAIHLSPRSYLQGQVSQWIPLSADDQYAGSILHYHFSLNRELARMLPDVPLVGTLELNGWTFQHGSYTDPVLGTVNANDETYLSLGPGLRVIVCDKIDFGVGVALALTDSHWAERQYRSEFRWRF